jgi:hypothetical protein
LCLWRPYRRMVTARQHCDTRPPACWRENGAGGTIFVVRLFCHRVMRLLEQKPNYWHFWVCARLLTGPEPPGSQSVTSLPRRSPSSPRMSVL